VTNEELKRIEELEAEFSEFLSGTETVEQKKDKCLDAVLTLAYYDKTDPEYFSFCKENFPRLNELEELYSKCLYTPDGDEKVLAYLFREGMTVEEKLKALERAYATANNSGYCDSMAARLEAGLSDSATDRWQRNVDNKYAIDRYYRWLAEQNK
jgi:hypothetical protein